jgi:hypothetical protein
MMCPICKKDTKQGNIDEVTERGTIRGTFCYKCMRLI